MIGHIQFEIRSPACFYTVPLGSFLTDHPVLGIISIRVAEVAEQMTVFITIDRFSYQLLTVHLIILHIIGGITCICTHYTCHYHCYHYHCFEKYICLHNRYFFYCYYFLWLSAEVFISRLRFYIVKSCAKIINNWLSENIYFKNTFVSGQMSVQKRTMELKYAALT